MRGIAYAPKNAGRIIFTPLAIDIIGGLRVD